MTNSIIPDSGAKLLSQTLAWLDTLSFAERPEVERKARLLLLDTLACMVAGLGAREPRELASRLCRLEHGPIRLPSINGGLTPSSAAFTIAMASCWHEACEGLARAHGRPGLHAVPVAVSLGLAKGGSLRKILEAIVCGYEIGGRAGEAMRIRAGLHVDGTWGLLGAIAAACRMMDFPPLTTLAALMTGACQIPMSLYAPVAAGCTARNTYAGHACAAAVQLALSAAAGITAPQEAFEAAAAGLSDNNAPSQVSWAPPGEFLILEGYLKPFAAVRHVHYAAACAIQRWAKHGGDTSAIRELALLTYPEAVIYCGNRAPVSAIQAQFSLSHGVAFALQHGALDPSAYAQTVFQDPETRRLEKLIQVKADESMSERGARLHVTASGVREEYSVTSVLGDPDQPMMEDHIRRKVDSYVSPVLGAAGAKALTACVLESPLDNELTLPAAGEGRPSAVLRA